MKKENKRKREKERERRGERRGERGRRRTKLKRDEKNLTHTFGSFLGVYPVGHKFSATQLLHLDS